MNIHHPIWLTLATITSLATPALSAAAQCEWQPLGAGFNENERGVGVSAFAVHQSQLIAGGSIEYSADTAIDWIARWDGSEWHQVGEGLPGPVNALTIYNGELIAGGYFDIAGEVHNVMRFDGNSWHVLPGGPNFSVYALTVYDGDLIAGGYFYEAFGAPGNNVARWNGTSWQPLGNGIDDDNIFYSSVNALAVHNGDLIAGGTFFEAWGSPGNMVARWDGKAWHPLGSGMDDSLNPGVFALTTYQGELIAGGDFLVAGGNSVKNLARWNGSVWSDPGNPATDGRVRALTVFNGELIAGKNNTEGGTLNMMDRWNGLEWSALQPNIDDTSTIMALTVFDSALIAGGGFFTLPDGEASNGVASWCAAPALPTCAADIEPPPTGNGTVDVDDLLAVINDWGSCKTCAADIAPEGGNGVVDVDDLLEVINAWGSCN